MKKVNLVGIQTTIGAGVFKSKDEGVAVDVVLKTDGSGFWNDSERSVRVIALSVPYITDEEDFGELRVYFDMSTWNTDIHGLIYTDDSFLRGLKKYLESLNLGTDVDYSEQGMQGDNYVSLDAGKKFIQSWIKFIA